ncbi:hypothetical protein ALC56_08107 [Trachymyrmex septentrionalis]|uniref:Uncharacterized protein n=1 Tax=Trachymyrmex septentrionalis TaxID=34720 RepID=A0A195FAU7_9HYME|nr:hypothetical protein ALC56_08107 [Trachymyrmex septentrionalis]
MLASGGSLLNRRAINALSFELHIPCYQFCSPSIRLTKRLARGDTGINPLDATYREYDIVHFRSNDLTDRYAADKVFADKADKTNPLRVTMDVCIEFDCKENVSTNTTAYCFIIVEPAKPVMTRVVEATSLRPDDFDLENPRTLELFVQESPRFPVGPASKLTLIGMV